MAGAFQAHHLQPQHLTTSFSALSLNSNWIRAYLNFNPFNPNVAKPFRSTTKPNQCQRQLPHTILIVDLNEILRGFFFQWFVVGFWVFFFFSLGIFSEVLGFFLHWFSGFLVGFPCDCSGVLSGFFCWVSVWLQWDSFWYFLDCNGERVGWDGEKERKKLGWDGVTEEKWERRKKRLGKEISTEKRERN